jgi:hypothetical protein
MLEASAKEQAAVMGRGRPEAEARAAAQGELERMARRAADGAAEAAGASGGGAEGPLGGVLRCAARLQEAGKEQCLPAEWLEAHNAG